jgi:hypothetical protein
MKNQILATFAMALTIFGAMSLAAADSDNLAITADVGNVAPYISSMSLSAASYDPTENTTTLVTTNIQVVDGNGVGDLNDSACKCEVDDTAIFSSPVAKYTNTSCLVVTDVDAFTRQYRCTWNMNFYDSAGNYSTKFTAADQAGTTYNDTAKNSPNYDYTELIASYLDSTAVAWTNPAFNTANVASNAPTIAYNSGNVGLDMNITGANLTAVSKPDLDVGWFSVDIYTNASTEVQLLTSVQAITGASIAQGSDGTPNPARTLYWFFDTPVTIQPATYTGQWVLGEYKP